VLGQFRSELTILDSAKPRQPAVAEAADDLDDNIPREVRR
jgi:hypothetical protein